MRARAGPGRSGACPGCGAVLPGFDGPTHAYVGASPACWDVYRRLLSPTVMEEDTKRRRRLLEHTYAVQHPGVPERRALQSVALHLMGLCLLIERDAAGLARASGAPAVPGTHRRVDLHWLTPPEPNGAVTAVDALAAGASRADGVEMWARDVWAAWAPHHATVRGWLGASSAPAG